ncbi:MAG TPA: SDR family oxidoreductase [Bryobacteraceae bacterium]|nr:SDR family oxidoreductase [Bryobacteraceae bacterium]
MQLKIFLTGATGYIGSAIADAALAAGHSVTGLARSDEAARKLSLKGIIPHRGDLTSTATLAGEARNAGAVIHTGTTNDGSMDREAVRVMTTALHASNKPLIYTSGVWVLGDTGGRSVGEIAPLNPLPQVAWRPGVEQMVLETAREGVRAIVIRPAIVYGRAGGIPADLVRSARETGAARYVGTGENHWPMIHLDDLADLYLRALEQAAAGTLLHAADGTAYRLKQIAEAASIGAGTGGRTESWPLEDARKTLGPYADALALDQQVSAEKARATLGWTPRAPSVIDDLKSGSYTK